MKVVKMVTTTSDYDAGINILDYTGSITTR